VPDHQDRAAQVDQDDNSGAGVGAPQRRLNPVAAGSEATVGTASGGLHAHLVPGNLADDLGEATGQGRAVRHQYNPDHIAPRVTGSALAVYTTDLDSAMPNTTRRSTIQAIDRAAGILQALAGGPQRLGVSELAARLGLARPTVHGILQTLVAHGFVEQDPASDKYQLGPGLLQLGYSYLDLNELRARSSSFADRLAIRTNAAVRVGVMHGPSIVVVHHVFRPDSTFQVLEVGSQLPLHASALGKAVLAFMPIEVIDGLLSDELPRLTKRTANAAGLRAQLRTIRDEGIATERDEAVLGESSIAAPIFDQSQQAVGAIGVVGDTERIFASGAVRSVTTAVIEAARGVSRALGAARWPALEAG
jgi:DNA-binding IclR family transcriptional regulator